MSPPVVILPFCHGTHLLLPVSSGTGAVRTERATVPDSYCGAWGACVPSCALSAVMSVGLFLDADIVAGIQLPLLGELIYDKYVLVVFFATESR